MQEFSIACAFLVAPSVEDWFLAFRCPKVSKISFLVAASATFILRVLRSKTAGLVQNLMVPSLSAYARSCRSCVAVCGKSEEKACEKLVKNQVVRGM